MMGIGIPSFVTLIFYREVLKRSKENNAHTSIFWSYISLFLTNLGIGGTLIFILFKEQTGLWDALGTGLAFYGITLLLVIASLTEGIMTVYFLRKYGNSTTFWNKLQSAIVFIIIASLITFLGYGFFYLFF